MTRDGRRRWVIALKIALAIGLLAAVVVLNRQSIRDVLHRRPSGRPFALGFLAYVAGLVLAYVRWAFYVKAVGVPFRLADGLRLGFIANLYNFVVPGGPVGGDVVRAVLLCREQRAWKAQAIASVVLDRLVGVLALFLLAAGAGSFAWGRLDPPVRRLVIVAWAVVGVVTAVLAFAFSPALYRPLAGWLAHRPRRAKRIQKLAAMGSAYRERLGVVVLGLIGAMVTHMLNILAFYEASAALLPSMPSLAMHILIVPLVLVTTAVPLPFAALGLSEGVSAHLFRLANDPAGAVAMMGFRVLQYGTAIISAAVYARSARQVGDLAEAAEELETLA